MDGYVELLHRWARWDRRWEDTRLSMDYALSAIEHPDFDVPGVMVTTPTGRVMLIVEGEKELVGPVIEKALEQFDALRSAVGSRHGDA